MFKVNDVIKFVSLQALRDFVNQKSYSVDEPQEAEERRKFVQAVGLKPFKVTKVFHDAGVLEVELLGATEEEQDEWNEIQEELEFILIFWGTIWGSSNSGLRKGHDHQFFEKVEYDRQAEITQRMNSVQTHINDLHLQIEQAQAEYKRLGTELTELRK